MDTLLTILSAMILLATPFVVWMHIRSWRESKRRMKEIAERNRERVARWEEG